jgi:16S rRNA (uracil1498-N3)-methyltransferase
LRRTRLYHPQFLTAHSQITLSDQAAHYLLHVLRLNEGDELDLFDGSGIDYSSQIIQKQKKSVRIQIKEGFAVDNESPIALHLIQGICRPDKMDWILQKATELGVSTITPVLMQRSQGKLDRYLERHSHWQAVIQSACEQSGRSKLPQLDPACLFTDVKLSTDDPVFYLDPESNQKFSKSLLNFTVVPSSFQLIIGPEGGFHDDEINALQKHAEGVRLGPRILRTETAALAVLSILQSYFGDF